MIRNGFTLIELLAVIVILAIIAVIAIPIVLNIISDIKDNSNKRSIDLYSKAVENAVALYQLNGTSLSGKFTTTDGKTVVSESDEKIQFNIDYSGSEVVCDIFEIYEDGNFYLSNCKVNKILVEEYSYGIKQDKQKYKPQYYFFNLSSGKIGDNLPNIAKPNASEIKSDDYPYYLGFDIDSNNKVTEAYLCFVRNDIEYCLKGKDAEAYETNKAILQGAFKDVDNACSVFETYFKCRDNTQQSVYFEYYIYSSGYIEYTSTYTSTHSDDPTQCEILTNGSYECYTDSGIIW